MRLTLALLCLPAALVAQSPDTTQGIPLPISDSALRLPADRAGDLLPWLPGGSIDPDGHPVWRGIAESELGRSIDGVLWASLVRPLRLGATTPTRQLAPSLNALGPSALLPGAYDVSEGSGGQGLLRFTTRPGGERWSFRANAESGDPYQHQGGEATTRFDGAVGGPLAAGWRVGVEASVLGRRSLPAGVGYRSDPYWRPVGIDTTFRWESTPGDTVSAPLQLFGATTRIPTSPRTTTDFTARLDGRVTGARLWARYLRGTEAERLFNYLDESNPFQSFGRDGRSQDLAAGIELDPIAGWTLAGHLGWQEERTQEGPIDPAAQLDSRDPSLGLLTGGAGLLYTLSSFPVDDELLWNYRLNIAGSRRTPYDLENTDQYRLIDNYRNNAYAVNGFDEGGGPVGLLALYRDRRVGGQVRGTHAFGDGRLTLGVEMRRHDIASYSSQLTSQAFSDVWMARPLEEGAFASWQVGGAQWSVTAGLRLDRFNTRARRPKGFPRIASMACCTWVDGATGDTLRTPYDPLHREAWWESISTPDRWHSAWSPRIDASGRLAAGVTAHASVGRFARVPDLSRQLAGINTDLGITDLNFVYGSDYGYETTDLIEGGVGKAFARGQADLTLFRQRHNGVPGITGENLFDPLKNQNNNVWFWVLKDGATETGLTASADYRPTPAVRLAGAYTLISTDASALDEILAPDSIRKHTFMASVEARSGSSGLLAGFEVLASYRRASGLARAVDPGVGPFFPGVATGSGLPAWSSVDLRLTKQLPLRGSTMVIFIDARNLFNAEDLRRAFGGGNPVRSVAAQANRFSADSASWAAEALRNGRYDLGTIDLTFGLSGCGGWLASSGAPNPPNCGYLLAAESRFGNGDGLFTVAEQRAASLAYYFTQFGPGAFNGPPHAIRFGAQLGI